MKNKLASIIVSVLFLCSARLAVAQAGLQFVQVQHFDIAASGTVAISVPSGKVWKVESVSMGSSRSAPAVLLKNASAQNIAFFSSPVSAVSASYPYWLPAGFSGSFLNNNPSYRCSISVTEYTVVP